MNLYAGVSLNSLNSKHLVVMKHFILLVTLIAAALTANSQQSNTIYKSKTLEIDSLSSNTFLHRSFLPFGQSLVPSNGLAYINNGECVVLDTPVNDAVADELIRWIKQRKHAKVKFVVAHHSHEDCLGGLRAFHRVKAKSYSYKLTQKFAQNDTILKPAVPEYGFDSTLTLNIGNQIVTCHFLGEAHTRDNIVTYIPSEKILFGGCAIKELGAGKGYVAEANVSEWPNTARAIEQAFPEAMIVVPGHGKRGGRELLTYTVKLFSR